MPMLGSRAGSTEFSRAGRPQVLAGLMAAALLAWGVFAPAAQASSPGTALQFQDAGDYVRVPHAPALNAYPLTITAWIKRRMRSMG